MKKLLTKLCVIIGILLVLGILAVILFLDKAVKSGVETAGPMITQTPVKLEGASISLLGGSAKLKGFLVGNPSGYKTDSAVKVGNISVSLKPMSVISDKIIVNSVNVEGPEITFEGGLTENNLFKIRDNVNAAAGGSSDPANKTPTEKTAAGKKIQITDFVMSGAKVHVHSALLGGKPMTVTIPEIHLTNLGTGSDGITAADLTKKVWDELLVKVIPAVTEQLTNLGKGALDNAKNLGGEGKKSLEKATSGLKGLLKK